MQYQHWLAETTSTGSIVTCVEAKHMRILTICVYMCVSHTLDIHNKYVCIMSILCTKDICLGMYLPFIFVPKDTFPAIDQGFEEDLLERAWAYLEATGSMCCGESVVRNRLYVCVCPIRSCCDPMFEFCFLD